MKKYLVKSHNKYFLNEFIKRIITGPFYGLKKVFALCNRAFKDPPGPP